MTAPSTMYTPAMTDLLAHIADHDATWLADVLPGELIELCRPYGLVTLGQLYACDCNDLRNLFGFTPEQIASLGQRLNADLHPSLAADKHALRLQDSDEWVTFHWPWLPAGHAHEVVTIAALAVPYLPPLWFCRTRTQEFVMNWLREQYVAVSIRDLKFVSDEAVESRLSGLTLEQHFTGRANVSHTAQDIVDFAQLISSYAAELGQQRNPRVR